MRLILASNNKNKLREFKQLVEGMDIELLSQSEAGLHLDVEETGTTFEENAYLKAKAVTDALGCAAVADDSGLVVDALGGEPGVYSARYGPDMTLPTRTGTTTCSISSAMRRTAARASCAAYAARCRTARCCAPAASARAR